MVCSLFARLLFRHLITFYILPTAQHCTSARNISLEYLFVLCMHTILHESDTLNVDVVPLNDIVCIIILYIFE